MKNTQKILIILIVFILILIGVITIVITSNMDKEKIEIQSLNENFEESFELKQVKSATQFKILDECVEKYYAAISDKTVYNLLINDYIKNNNITQNNISIKFEVPANNNEYLIDIVFEYESDLSIKTYFVYGYMVDKDSYKKQKDNFVINIDNANSTFEISPLDNVYEKYIKKENDKIVNIDKNIKTEIQNIKLNETNSINTSIAFKEKDMLQFYFNQYISNLVYNTEKAYALLDDSYKQKRFSNYESFENYITSNREDIEKSFIMKYKIEEFAGYKEYLTVDNYGNYYIFKETTPMEYTVLLDQYTASDKIFTDEYYKKENNKKAQMELNRFNQMLNRQDYTSAYNVLNKEFKDKYFKAEEEFKQYVLDNWYKYNDFKYEEVSGNEDQFKIKTTIKNKLIQEKNVVKRFRVDLTKDGFYISFDM